MTKEEIGTVAAAPCCRLTVCRDGRILEGDGKFFCRLGCPPPDSLAQAVAATDRARFESLWRASVLEGSAFCLELRLQRGDGSTVAAHCLAQEVSDAGHLQVWLTAAGPGEAARDRAVEALQELATRDALTGLFNRRSFEAYVAQALSTGRGGVFFMCDLDDFKSVNDTFGHDCGDRILQGMADAMRAQFPDEAICGRMGGDEFSAFVPGAGRETAGAFCAALQRRVELHPALQLEGLACSVCVGAAVAEPGDLFASLYRRADLQLYLCKQHRQHRVAGAELIAAAMRANAPFLQPDFLTEALGA